MSKTIKLTRNKSAIVDDKNYNSLNRWKWYTLSAGHNSKIYYAARWKKGKQIFMHREIIKPPDKLMTDHINGNGLDNRKCNLRIVTNSINQLNRHSVRNSRGYYWNKRDKRWMAYICLNGKLKFLGYFKKRKDAKLRRLNVKNREVLCFAV